MTGLRTLAILSILGLASCDQAKNFIDPSGRAYAKADSTGGKQAPPASTTSKSNATTPASATPSPTSTPSPVSAPSASAPKGSRETEIRAAAHAHNLSRRQAWAMMSTIQFRDDHGSWTFNHGVARQGGILASLVDSAGKPWGFAQGDLDLDGEDDAMVVIRLDQKSKETRWELAFLRNSNGILFNTQTVDLPGTSGYRDAAVTGSSLVLVPETGPNVHVTYSGGGLSVQ